jgi:uncharacterized membrane protein YoaK (UPF0700 family)
VAAAEPNGWQHTCGLLLTVAGGGLDAICFLGLGGVFARVMTGNMVLLGLSAGHRNTTLAAHAAHAAHAALVGLLVVRHPAAAPAVSLVLLGAGIVTLAVRRGGSRRLVE